MSKVITSNFTPFILVKEGGGGEIPNGILYLLEPSNKGGIRFVI